MIEKNLEKKKIIKKNLIFLSLLLVLSLIAWFGVKMIVVGSGTVNTATTKKSNSLIQTNIGAGGGGTPPADAGGVPPSGMMVPGGSGATPQ